MEDLVGIQQEVVPAIRRTGHDHPDVY